MEIVGRIDGVEKGEGEKQPLKIRIAGRLYSVWDAKLAELCVPGNNIKVSYQEKTSPGYKYPFRNVTDIKVATQEEIQSKVEEDLAKQEITKEKEKESGFRSPDEITAEVALREANNLIEKMGLKDGVKEKGLATIVTKGEQGLDDLVVVVAKKFFKFLKDPEGKE